MSARDEILLVPLGPEFAAFHGTRLAHRMEPSVDESGHARDPPSEAWPAPSPVLGFDAVGGG